jgi:hypothetical protein
MNDYDKANLEFILNADKTTLQEWYESLSEDDLDYAQELLHAASVLVDLRMAELCDDVPDVTLANIVLDKYRLK